MNPFIQNINAALHREPLASFVYGIYWISFLLFWIPLACIFLWLQLFYNMYTWFISETHFKLPKYDPSNKTEYDMAVVISGCDTGFGKDTALLAANAGYTVFAGCLQETSFQQFDSMKNNITPFVLDVTKDDDVVAAAKRVDEWLQYKNENKGGGEKTDEHNTKDTKKRVLHAVVNNAGIGIWGEADLLTLQEFQLLMDVNFYGTVRMCKSFLPILKDQAIFDKYDGMRIINVTSIAGLWVGSPGMAGYGPSKFAAQAFTTSLRLELNKFNISVGSVNPAFHATPISLFHDKYEQVYNRQPDHIKEQYGQAYYEAVVMLSEMLMKAFMWNANVVSEQILNDCLKSSRPPRELIVGSDARYFYMIFRMIPTSIWERIVNFVIRRPIPAGMLKNCKNGNNTYKTSKIDEMKTTKVLPKKVD